MKLGLGIDTGGTYTDSVIYDFDTKEILAGAKALTTKEDLSVGIIESMKKLCIENPEDINLVSLSTTLATNACVEDKGGRGKLVLLGYDKQLLNQLRSKYGLPDINEIIMIEGSHNQQGQVICQPDWDELKSQIKDSMEDTESYGIAEYWGIRNPSFEQEAKRRIKEWTGKPVVCAHELSSEINSLRRASTTLLNSKLITLIDDLINAVQAGMSSMGISAPIMIVKGDGTMMSEAYAKDRPVETLLSGPAASVIGGMKLTGCRDALILDMGGTTSDLALIRDGLTVLSEEGVDIGICRTGTKAIKIKTIGLGGDSIISFDKHEKLTIGPRKAAPLSWLLHKWPQLKDELRQLRDDNKWHSLSLAEFYYLVNEPDEKHYFNEAEKKIIATLKEGPKSITALAEETASSVFFLQTENLENHGIVGKGALTPSDIMHITGEYKEWDAEAALLGAQIMAGRLKMTLDDLIKAVNTGIVYMLYSMIAEFLLNKNMQGRRASLSRDTSSNGAFSKDALALMDMGFDNPYDEIKLKLSTPLPIIGIGAPAHIYLHQAAEALGTKAIITKDAGVANALGAITGSIIGEETVLIRPRYSTTGVSGYGCHASTSYFETDDYEEALTWSKETAAKNAEAKARTMGASEITVQLEENENQFKTNEVEMLMETVITAKGIGNQAIFSRV